MMAVCCLFYLTFFKAGLPEKLPIGVVDYDNSSLSRNFCSQLDATQLGKVVHFDSFSEARDAMQTGEVASLCVIPKDMAADVYANRRPTFTYYVNSLYMIAGALGYKDVLTMVTLTGGAVQREVFRAKGYAEGQIMGLIQPIVIDEHHIGNPMTSYSIYLNNIILPGLLCLSIVFVLIYALCSELRYGTSRELMETAGGSFATALLGKLTPYTVLYLLMGLLLDLLMYGVCKFPVAGSVGNMILLMLVFIIACEAVAVTIVGLVPVLRIALSIAAHDSRILIFRIHIPGRGDAESNPGHCSPFPAAILLSRLCPGGNLRHRNGRLVAIPRLSSSLPCRSSLCERTPEESVGKSEFR